MISLQSCLIRPVQGFSRLHKRGMLLTLDCSVTLLAFCIAVQMRNGVNPAGTATVSLALLALSAGVSIALRMPNIKLNANQMPTAVVTAKFALFVTLGLASLGQIVGLHLALSQLLAFGSALLLGCIGGRLIMRGIFLWVLRHGQDQKGVLIYGAGRTGLQIAAALRMHHSIRPVAFIDDDVELQGMIVGGLPVLSPTKVEAVMRGSSVTRVLLAMPSVSTPKLAQIAYRLQSLGLEVKTLPSFNQLVGTNEKSAVDARVDPERYLQRQAIRADLTDCDLSYAGKSVLVSGAGGSVGAELCRQLLSHQPRKLVLYERSEIALYMIDRELRANAAGRTIEIVGVLGSVTDPIAAQRAMIDAGVDVVFHAAAYKHVPLIEANPVAGLANNVVGTSVFANAARASGASRFVLISTDKAVRPKSVMGGTKRLAELVVQDIARKPSKTQFSIVRFGNVLGSSGSVLPLFRDQIARGGPVTLTDDDVTRYFMTLGEAAHLVLLAGAFSRSDCVDAADVFVLDMGQPVRIRDLAERMIRAEGLSLRDQDNPGGDIEIVTTGLRPGEKLHEEALVGQYSLETPHPKILRTQETGLSAFAMANAMIAVRAAIDTGNQDAARAVLGTWVEGFAADACHEHPHRVRGAA